MAQEPFWDAEDTLTELRQAIATIDILAGTHENEESMPDALSSLHLKLCGIHYRLKEFLFSGVDS